MVSLHSEVLNKPEKGVCGMHILFFFLTNKYKYISL